MDPNLVLGAAYILTTLVKQGITIKQILDAADDAGAVDPALKAQILADLRSVEAAWAAKRNPT